MRTLLIAAAAAAILAGGAAATLAITDSSLALAGSTTSTLPAVAPARTTEDVSGPCDEAEHANDARCAGTTTATKPAGQATPREDRAGPRHRGRHGRSGSSSSGSGSSGDDSSGRGGGNNGHGDGDDSGHGGGGHGRDHAEDD